MSTGSYQMPQFHSYPPYFTLQPNKESREKQITLWHDLILSYCKHHKIFVIPASATEKFELFTNQSINRSLNQEAITAILGAAVTAGHAEWLDGTRQNCLVYWRSVNEWANILFSFAHSTGMSDLIMTVDEISTGVETRGTELEGVDKQILLRAIACLEKAGKARLFSGEAGDDDGVKFFT